MSERLHPDDVEAIARRVAELLQPAATAPGALVDVKALASVLGVSKDFIYEHAVELGGVKLAGSPKAPWRFDVERARGAMAERAQPAQEARPLPRRPRARRARASAAGVELLPIRGGGA